MRFGSVCSGIEAASVAFAPLGWSAAWFAEVDIAASAVLAHRLGATAPVYPMDGTERAAKRIDWGNQITNWGDMTKLPDLVLSGDAEAPDVLCGGTPCQSFSIAGLRDGLEDPRGQLTLSFVQLADAIDTKRAERGEEPCIIFWENVPGAHSDEGNAFGHFIAALVGETEPIEPGPRPERGKSTAHWRWKKDPGLHIPKWSHAGVAVGPKRTIAWRRPDAQYFGLAQRRERLFVVGSARAGFDPGEVLLEFDGVRRDFAPSRSAGEETAGTLDARTSGGGFPGTDGAVVPSERSGAVAPTWWDGSPVSQTLDAVLHKGQTMPEKNRFPAVLQPVAFVQNTRDEVRLMGGDGQIVGALPANAGAKQQCYIAQEPLCFDTTQITSPSNYSNPKPGDPCHPLAAAAHVLAVCVTGDVTHTLRAEGFDASEDGTGRGNLIVVHGTQDPCVGEVAFALGRNSGGENALYEPLMAVRRLMPVECERLQGFPTVTELDVGIMTRDEVIVAALINKDIIVDSETGEVFGTRGPGGIPLSKPRRFDCIHPSGYRIANLTANGVKRQVRLHRVVWISEHGVPEVGLVVAHRDNNKANNRIENLKLISAEQNSTEASEDGLYQRDEHPITKLVYSVRYQLWQDYHAGDVTYADLMEKYGISKSRVGQIVNETGWTEVPIGKGVAADGPRYKQLGNSWPVPVVRWIGRRIQAQIKTPDYSWILAP